MKIIRIYHRKELVGRLEMLIHTTQDIGTWYPYQEREHCMNRGSMIRRFRIKYGIYETF